MAQAIHAAIEFQHEHPFPARDWHKLSNYLVVVNTPDEASLQDLVRKATHQGLAYSIMRESDLGNEITAVAFQPGAAARKLCARLPLALRSKGTSGPDQRGSLRDPDTSIPSATLNERTEGGSHD